jgi:hypothetical protein
MMAGWVKVREHIWTDEHGSPLLRHTKYLLPNGDVAFPWEHRRHWPETGIERWLRGNGASDGIAVPLLYPLPTFAGAHRDEHIYICEGEADVDAALAQGLIAVTAGHAGAFGREQADLLEGWQGRISIVRDNDLPGAYGAAKAYDALRAVGVPASRLRVARGQVRAVGADLRDHIDAGHSLHQLVAEPIAAVRRLATRATAEEFRRAGYGDWVVVGADESAQLSAWKPRAS